MISITRKISCLLAASLFAIACGNNNPSTLSFDANALELESGGVTTTDEAPAFGDSVIAAEQTDDATLDAVTPEEDAAAERVGAKVYYLAAAWGQLRWARHPALPPSPSDAQLPMPTLWNGTLCAATPGVAVRALRAVRFEGRTDRIVRRGPDCVEWRSATLPAWDGILVRVVVGPAVAADATVLNFTTAAASATVANSELAGLHRVIDVNNDRGDRVAMVASPRPRCAGGFIQGRWMRLSQRGGVFAGRFEAHDGAVTGHVRGIWGTRQNGERVLFGKVIGADGRLIGRLHGTFGDGRLRAVFESRDGAHTGVLFGRYAGEDGRGYFRAVHARACAERPDACSCDAAPPTASTPDAVPPCRCEAPAQ